MPVAAPRLIVQLLLVYLAISYAALWYTVLHSRKLHRAQRIAHAVNATPLALTAQLPPAEIADLVKQASVNACTRQMNAIFMLATKNSSTDWTLALSRLQHLIFYWHARGLEAHTFVFADDHALDVHAECLLDKYCHFVLESSLESKADSYFKRIALQQMLQLSSASSCANVLRDVLVMRAAGARESPPTLGYDIIDRAALAPFGHGTCLESHVQYNTRHRCLLYILRHDDAARLSA